MQSSALEMAHTVSFSTGSASFGEGTGEVDFDVDAFFATTGEGVFDGNRLVRREPGIGVAALVEPLPPPLLLLTKNKYFFIGLN